MEFDVDWKEIVAAKDARIAELEALVKLYEERLRLAKSRQYGSASEKAEISGQLSFFDEVENTADRSVPEPELEEVVYKRRKRTGQRKEDLSGMPTEIVEHQLPESERICPECGWALHEMGHDCRREISLIPAQVKVVEHRRAVYACRNCEKHNDHVPIVKAPVPEAVICGSLASPSAVAHIMTQKYVMCAPLYRQEQEWKRQGVVLSRQTMANWVIRCAEEWLQPLYDRLRRGLLGHEVLHGDETVVQVLREPGKAPSTNSYMWVYRTGRDTREAKILFEYRPSRASVHPQEFLRGFKGLLHADGYAGYHTLPAKITVIGCWVHMRRKFADAVKVIPAEQRSDSVAQEAIQRIGYLFHLEELWKNQTAEERHSKRQQESKPHGTIQ